MTGTTWEVIPEDAEETPLIPTPIVADAEANATLAGVAWDGTVYGINLDPNTPVTNDEIEIVPHTPPGVTAQHDRVVEPAPPSEYPLIEYSASTLLNDMETFAPQRGVDEESQS